MGLVICRLSLKLEHNESSYFFFLLDGLHWEKWWGRRKGGES